LEQIIEKVSYVTINGSVLLSAIKAYAKINSEEQVREQAQDAGPKKLFERMSKEEREAFARDGTVPNWFSGATPSDGQEGEKESQDTEATRLQ
jgi:hypothetical protein